MCFNFFKKKNKVKNNVEMPKDYLQWNKMMELWGDGKLESPYSELIEYLNGVNNGGHYMNFDNVSCNGDLKKYVEQVASILPKVLKDNINRAYKTYKVNPDDMTEKDVAILDECDKVYFENEEEINKILRDRASKIEL